MLSTATAMEFVRPVTQGRTGPALLVCATEEGQYAEVFCKFSAGCDQGNANLAREVVAACLAADLNLPVPMPYLVEVPEVFSEVVRDEKYKEKIKASSRIAFGSIKVPSGFSVWTSHTNITNNALQTAASVLVFDAIIQNPDRRSDNPNCLVRGDEVRIFDHELAFTGSLVIGWQPPWALGGLRPLETPGYHIFREGLRRRDINFAPIRAQWERLSDARLQEYEDVVAGAWGEVGHVAEDAVNLIKGARDRIDDCLTEVRRILA